MKKNGFLCACIAISLFCLSACGQQAATQGPAQTAEQGESVQEYHLTAGETLDVSGQTFDEPVVVYVDPNSTSEAQSLIQFFDCTFGAGLTMIGDRSGWIRLYDECKFENDSFITVKEATAGSMKTGKLEDDFLKLSVDQPNLKVESTALLNTISRQDVTINGTEYKLSDFPDCNIFCAAYYYENGELTVYTEGWVEDWNE